MGFRYNVLKNSDCQALDTLDEKLPAEQWLLVNIPIKLVKGKGVGSDGNSLACSHL